MSGTAVTLKEKAYIELRRLILDGELKPGEVLTERMLVELLQMSRTPIRAALERLDAEGMANYTPNKGLIVADISLSRTIDLYDYRIAMECFVVRKVAGTVLDEEDVRWFEDNLERQREYAEASDFGRFTEADTLFHWKLAAIYGNGEIVQAMERLQDKLHRIAVKVLRKDRSRIKISYEDHVRILQAVRDGDGAEAARRMEEHLEFGKRILVL